MKVQWKPVGLMAALALAAAACADSATAPLESVTAPLADAPVRLSVFAPLLAS